MFNGYQQAANYDIVSKSFEGDVFFRFFISLGNTTANDDIFKTLMAGATYSGPPPPLLRTSHRVLAEVAKITKLIEEFERHEPLTGLGHQEPFEAPVDAAVDLVGNIAAPLEVGDFSNEHIEDPAVDLGHHEHPVELPAEEAVEPFLDDWDERMCAAGAILADQALIARLEEQADELFWLKRFNTGTTVKGK